MEDRIELEISEGKIKNLILINKITPMPVAIMLCIFAAIFYILPFVVAYYSYQESGKPEFFLLPAFAMCWFMGTWFLRMMLWNRFGKELFKFTESTVQYIADYKWYQKKPVIIKKQDCIVGLHKIDDKLGKIIFFNEKQNEDIQSALVFPINTLEKIINKINVEVVDIKVEKVYTLT